MQYVIRITYTFSTYESKLKQNFPIAYRFLISLKMMKCKPITNFHLLENLET